MKQIVTVQLSIRAEDIFDAYEYVEEHLMPRLLREERVGAVTMLDQRCPRGCAFWPCRHADERKKSK